MFNAHNSADSQQATSDEVANEFDQLAAQIPLADYEDVPPMAEEALYTWVAPERIFRPRLSMDFKRNLILLLALIVLLLIFLSNLSLLIVVLSLIFFMFVVMNVPPLKIRHTLTNYGIYVGDHKFYSWKDRGVRFWWEQSHGQNYVVVETRVFPYKIVMLEGLEGNKQIISNILGAYLLEQKPPQTEADKLIKWFRETFPLE